MDPIDIWDSNSVPKQLKTKGLTNARKTTLDRMKKRQNELPAPPKPIELPEGRRRMMLMADGKGVTPKTAQNNPTNSNPTNANPPNAKTPNAKAPNAKAPNANPKPNPNPKPKPKAKQPAKPQPKKPKTPPTNAKTNEQKKAKPKTKRIRRTGTGKRRRRKRRGGRRRRRRRKRRSKRPTEGLPPPPKPVNIEKAKKELAKKRKYIREKESKPTPKGMFKHIAASFNLHLDKPVAVVGAQFADFAENNEKVRRAQAEDLAKFVNLYQDDYHVIVVGDFNC